LRVTGGGTVTVRARGECPPRLARIFRRMRRNRFGENERKREKEHKSCLKPMRPVTRVQVEGAVLGGFRCRASVLVDQSS
jgi:hypothetical protein